MILPLIIRKRCHLLGGVNLLKLAKQKPGLPDVKVENKPIKVKKYPKISQTKFYFCR